MKITFLVQNVYGIGGTNRTVLNLAGALAARHEVHVVSVFRRQDGLMLGNPPGVRIRPLVDVRRGRPDARHPLTAQNSQLVPPSEEYFSQYTALTDERISGFLRRTDSDVVIGTRPSLNLLVARFGRDRALRLAQEHMTHEMIPDGVKAAMRQWYPRLHASVTLTEADAAESRAATPIPGLLVATIPNGVPEPVLPPSDCREKLVVAAGRLDPVKRYDVLVHAFAEVAARRPDWRLRIYGGGVLQGSLRNLIAQLGLHNHVFLMGRAGELEAEWVKGSIAAVTSDKESFGMTLVEAMRCGLPVVSTDCPVGPREIVRDGEDGLLVPVGDAKAVAAGLLRLIEDDEERRRMGRAAAQNSQRFAADRVAARYEELFATLGRPSRPAARRGNDRTTDTSTTVRSLAGRVVPGRLHRRLGLAPQVAADCEVLPNGDLALMLDPPPLPLDGLRVVCRARGGKSALVRLALHPVSGEEPVAVRRLRAVLPAPMPGGPVGEGRWDLFLEDRGGALHRLKPGIRDLRHLSREDADRTGGAAAVARYVPYRTLDGNLAVRCLLRERHAEAGSIWYRADSIAVEGRLVGECFGDEPPLLTVRRRQPPQLEFEVPGTTRDGSGFRFELPVRSMVASLLTTHDDWDLWVTPRAGAEPLRVARLLDDVLEKKQSYYYPGALAFDEYRRTELGVPGEDEGAYLLDAPASEIRVKPFFTPGNELSVFVNERSA